MAHAARDALAAMLAEGPATIGEVGLDKYGGRMLAAAYANRSGDVSTALLEAGLARRYSGGRRQPWC
jgi:endonuclease YncB( thermonuclease family)